MPEELQMTMPKVGKQHNIKHPAEAPKSTAQKPQGLWGMPPAPEVSMVVLAW